MSRFRSSWREVASVFLKIDAMAYGGPAIMGIMQAELQEKRRWVDNERFMEGLALVNLLAGAGATQLGIFLGHARGGWWGGLLAGLCFVLPALFIMLALTVGYAALGATPIMRGALYGLGPVVLGIYAVAVFHLGKNAITASPQVLIAVVAALAMAVSSLGLVTVLALAGGIGILLFASRRQGLAVLAAIALTVLLMHYVGDTSALAPEAKVGAGETATGWHDYFIVLFRRLLNP
jgi:chromate transporter